MTFEQDFKPLEKQPSQAQDFSGEGIAGIMSFGGAVSRIAPLAANQNQADIAADMLMTDPSFKVSHQALYKKDAINAIYNGESEAIKEELAMDEEEIHI